MRQIVVLGVLAMMFGVVWPAVVPARQAQATAAASTSHLAAIYAPFLGKWTGMLEYRDYSTDEKQQLPAWLEVAVTADGKSLEFRYTYDDGPNKTVRELAIVTIDPATATFQEASEKDNPPQKFQVSGLEAFEAAGRGKLTLVGEGVENDKKVDVRIRMQVGRNFYHLEKETRAPGANFLFRDGYTFTRREAPGVPATK